MAKKSRKTFPSFSPSSPGLPSLPAKWLVMRERCERHVKSGDNRSCGWQQTRASLVISPNHGKGGSSCPLRAEGRADQSAPHSRAGSRARGPGFFFVLPRMPSVSKSSPAWEAFCGQAVCPQASSSPLWASVSLTENGTWPHLPHRPARGSDKLMHLGWGLQPQHH